MNYLQANFNTTLPGIDTLTIDGENQIFPWGLELAGRNFFFSLNGSKRGVDNFSHSSKNINETTWLTEASFQVAGVTIKLTISDEISQKSIIRKAYLSSDGDIEITGMALRHQFTANIYKTAVIENRTFTHENSGLYNMLPAEEVKLTGLSCSATVSYGDRKLPSGSKCYTYARDINDRWIIHSRVLPDPEHVDTTRIMRLPNKLIRYFRKIKIESIANILVKNNYLWQELWHRPERTLGNSIPISAYGLFSINRDTEFFLSTHVRFHQKKTTVKNSYE